MRPFLSSLFICTALLSQGLADEFAMSVDEAFPDPYAYECDDDGYVDIYDADVDETWYWEDEPIYPGRNEDAWMDELTKPWQ